MKSNDYQFGRYLAQVYSHDAIRMLEAIYRGYLEPLKPLPEAAQGIIDEISSWAVLGVYLEEKLNKCRIRMGLEKIK